MPFVGVAGHSGLFERALQRVLILPRIINHLIYLGLRHFIWIDAGNAAPVDVHLHHHAVRLGGALLEERLEHVDDELHRCVVVVQEHDVVERRLLDALADAFPDRAAGLVLVARSACHRSSVTQNSHPARGRGQPAARAAAA